MKVWSTSSEKGIQPQQRAYIPMMNRVSRVRATILPTEKATLRKRTRMYRKMAMRERMTALIAPLVISSATLLSTFCEETMEPPLRFSRSLKVA